MIAAEQRYLHREREDYHRTEVRAGSAVKAIHLRCNVIDLLAFKRECSWAWGWAVGMVVISFIIFLMEKSWFA